MFTSTSDPTRFKGERFPHTALIARLAKNSKEGSPVRRDKRPWGENIHDGWFELDVRWHVLCVA